MKVTNIWIIAVVVTVMAMVYQRATGPTNPKKTKLQIGDVTYKLKLTRSHGGSTDCPLEFKISDKAVSGTITYRKYPTSEEWTILPMSRKNDTLSVFLPHQPEAGKLEYHVEFQKEGKTFPLQEKNATVVRFKGDVPDGILIPHVLLMIIAMLFANLAGVMAVFKYKKFRFYTLLTLIILGLGGMFFGPWVQYHAFGDAWTGIPFAWDLTDNKTLIAFLFWILAVAMNYKKERPVYVIIASLIMLAVYSIPHSMFGSQLDPGTGKIIQGMIMPGIWGV
jgi:hypothetical protein